MLNTLKHYFKKVTETGVVIVLSLPSLKVLSSVPFLPRNNHRVLSTVTFLNDGIGAYLVNPFELQRFSYTEVCFYFEDFTTSLIYTAVTTQIKLFQFMYHYFCLSARFSKCFIITHRKSCFHLDTSRLNKFCSLFII